MSNLRDFRPSGVPVGTIAPQPANIPSGWLECDGSAVSRTTYAQLFAELGTTFGAGDGSTTFNLPDLRGESIRGYDNGRGVDSGRVLGSAQLDQMQQITGGFRAGRVGTNGGAITFNKHLSGGLNGTGSVLEADFSFDSANSPGARAGSETRMRNVATYLAIKY